MNLYFLFVYIEHNGDEPLKDSNIIFFFIPMHKFEEWKKICDI